MKVKALIALLRTLDQEREVCVDTAPSSSEYEEVAEQLTSDLEPITTVYRDGDSYVLS